MNIRKWPMFALKSKIEKDSHCDRHEKSH
uniref:Uncharacterized protein n=1 Tax=Arundo donax TaxID=35708 RepID=A0A0A8ZV82_ARUDO